VNGNTKHEGNSCRKIDLTGSSERQQIRRSRRPPRRASIHGGRRHGRPRVEVVATNISLGAVNRISNGDLGPDPVRQHQEPDDTIDWGVFMARRRERPICIRRDLSAKVDTLTVKGDVQKAPILDGPESARRTPHTSERFPSAEGLIGLSDNTGWVDRRQHRLRLPSKGDLVGGISGYLQRGDHGPNFRRHDDDSEVSNPGAVAGENSGQISGDSTSVGVVRETIFRGKE